MFTVSSLARRVALALGLAFAATGVAQAANGVGATFPDDFPVPVDASLGKPVIGFGAKGPVRRTPVIFLHGNDDAPYPTGCDRWGADVQGMADYFASKGYSPSELWALGYQGDQCDRISGGTFGTGDATVSSSLAHTVTANVPDLRAFVSAVLAYTGESKVDIVAHGLGVTLAREWVRQDGASKLVRRFVAIEGANAGIIKCSPDLTNYWQMEFMGGFKPTAPVCKELGSPNTPFFRTLNGVTSNKGGQRVDPASTLVIREGDSSFMYMSQQDGGLGAVPSVDVYGQPTDFSSSASLPGASEVVHFSQGGWDVRNNSAHIGIARSPSVWSEALGFLVGQTSGGGGGKKPR